MRQEEDIPGSWVALAVTLVVVLVVVIDLITAGIVLLLLSVLGVDATYWQCFAGVVLVSIVGSLFRR